MAGRKPRKAAGQGVQSRRQRKQIEREVQVMDYKKIFAEAKTAEELKKAYKKACLQLHPDKGGDPAEFKAMQAEYERHAARLAHEEAGGNYRHNQKADGTYKTAEELYNEDKAFRAVLDKILGLDGLEIEVCGNWLWVGGNTYEHRAALKEAGCKFASKKKMWYWQPGGWVKKTKGTLSMDKIRDLHGSEKLQRGERFIPPAPTRQPYMPSLF